MQRRGLAFVLLLFGCFASDAGDPASALQGTWQGDREATLAAAEACQCANREQRTWLEQEFGALTVEYTADTMTARLAKMTDAGPYVVVEKGDGWLDLRRSDLPEKQASVHRVSIAGDRMRVRVAHLGFEQVFRRVK